MIRAALFATTGVIALAVFVVTPSLAQNAPIVDGSSIVLGGKNAPPPKSALFTNIKLSQAQQDSIDVITRRYTVLYAKINHDNTDARAVQGKRLAMRRRERADKRKVLTPEQQAVFDVNAKADQQTYERIAKEFLDHIANPPSQQPPAPPFK